MKKIVTIAFILSIGLIAGCSDYVPYEDDEVAAIVRGEEITIGDLRFMYPDKNLLDMVEPTVHTTLVVQEAKRLDVEIPESSQELLEANDSIGYEANKAFARKQALKFDMDPEEYYELYEARANEIMVYVSAYVESMIEIPVDEDGNVNSGIYEQRVNKLLNELYAKYEDEIEILITE